MDNACNMHPARVIVLVLGLAVFIFGIYLLFFEAGLDRWVSIGILTAGVVILIGLVIMSFASSAPKDVEHGGTHHEHHEREVVRDRGPGGGVVEERRYRR